MCVLKKFRTKLFAFTLGSRLTFGSRGKMRPFQIGTGLAYALAGLVLYSGFQISAISHDRQTRLIASTAKPALGKSFDFYIRTRVLSYKQLPLTIELVASDLPSLRSPPPGLAEFPRRGVAYVSPQLAKEIASDPSLTFRLPGEISSQVIRSDGLVSPNELRAIVGVNPAVLTNDMESVGWGAVLAGYTDSFIPTSAFVLSSLLLVGLPLLLLLLVIGKLADSRKMARNRLFNLLGMDTKHRLRVESSETSILALAGGLAGGVLGMIFSSQIAEAFFGFRSFPISFHESLVIFFEVLFILVTIAILLAKLCNHGYQYVLSGKPTKNQFAAIAWKTLTGISLLSLLLIVLVGKFRPDYFLASSVVTVILVVASFGLMLGSYKVIGAILIRVTYLRHFRVMDVPIFLAARQIRMTSGEVARSSAGFFVMLIISAISISFVYDLNSLSQTPTGGLVLSMTVPKEGANGAIFKVPSKAMAYIITSSKISNSKSYASCESVSLFLGNVTTAHGGKCQNDRQYELVSSQSEAASSLGNVLISPNWKSSVLSSTSTLVTALPDVRASAHEGDLIIVSLEDGDRMDRFLSQAMKIQPLLYIDYVNIDASSSYRLPTIKRIVYSLTFVGLILGISTFYLGQLERFISRRQSRYFLSLLGTPRSVLDRSDELEFRINAWTVLALGTAVGWLVASAYLALGGHHDIFLNGVIMDLSFGSALILLGGTITKHFVSYRSS